MRMETGGSEKMQRNGGSVDAEKIEHEKKSSGLVSIKTQRPSYNSGISSPGIVSPRDNG